MKYPFLIKFSKITNLSDARYAAGMWADFVGFSFDPNDAAYIEPGKASEIKAWINGPKIVAEFGNQPMEWIEDFTKNLGIDVIEIPQDYADHSVIDQSYKVIVRMQEATMNAIAERADILLVSDRSLYDTFAGMTDKPILFEVGNLEMDASGLEGIALKGNMELSPGTSNQTHWTQFLERYAVED